MAYRSITSLELGNSRKRRGRRIKKVEAGNLSKYKYLQRFLFSLALNTVISACPPPRPDLQYDSRVVVRDHDVVADISVATTRAASRASLASASLTYRSIAEGGNRLPYEYFGD